MKFEVVELQLEGTALEPPHHLVDVLHESGLPVRGQPHDLVLAFVDREAQVGGEGRVEHPQGMRKAQLAQQLDCDRAFVGNVSAAQGQGRPLADAVRREDGRAPHRRGEESRGRVRLVVLGEEDPIARDTQLGGDDSLDPELAAERVLHRVGKASIGAGKGAEQRGENPVELEHRLLVEDDRVELFGLEARLLEAPFDCAQRKAGVVLAAREALLLRGTDGLPVDEQRGGAVVVVRAEAEDAQQYCDSSPGARRDFVQPGVSRGSSNAKGQRRRKYCARRTRSPKRPATAPAARG